MNFKITLLKHLKNEIYCANIWKAIEKENAPNRLNWAPSTGFPQNTMSGGTKTRRAGSDSILGWQFAAYRYRRQKRVEGALVSTMVNDLVESEAIHIAIHIAAEQKNGISKEAVLDMNRTLEVNQ